MPKYPLPLSGPVTLACRACKAKFVPRKPQQVFCADACRKKFQRTGAPSPSRLRQLVRECIICDMPALAKAVAYEIRKQRRERA